jgi:hypothetical protein
VINFNKITFQIDSLYLWGILALVIVVFAVVASILHFHWNNYNVEDGSKKIVKTFFWFISFSLIILATICLLVFELGVN